MKLSEVREILDAEIVYGGDLMDIEIYGVAASDLMSDLLRKPKEGALLLTGLTSIQAINTSVIAGMTAIVFVRGKRPDNEIVLHAMKHEIPILLTPYNMFSSCGILYEKGLRSIVRSS